MPTIQDNLYQSAIAEQNLIESVKEYIDNIFFEHKEELNKLITENYSEGVILPNIYKWFVEDKKEKENNKILNFEYKFKTSAHTWNYFKNYDNIISFKLISERGTSYYKRYKLEINIKIFCSYNGKYAFVEYEGEFSSDFHENYHVNKQIKNRYCLNRLGEKKEED